MSERKQREDRIRLRQSGGWSTTSATYFHAVKEIFDQSRAASGDDPIKPSRWTYAGLPVLIAGVEAFLIEHQHILTDSSKVKLLAGVDPLREVLKLYPLPDDLHNDLEDLIEIRNQIVHPAPVPFGKQEWPKSLTRLHELKLLHGNAPQSGSEALALLGNHGVFEWAVRRCAEALDVVAESDPERAWAFHQLAGGLQRVLTPAAKGHSQC